MCIFQTLPLFVSLDSMVQIITFHGDSNKQDVKFRGKQKISIQVAIVSVKRQSELRCLRFYLTNK